MEKYAGSCHCKAVVFEVQAREDGTEKCNCSICSMSGYLHLIVPKKNLPFYQESQNRNLYLQQWCSSALFLQDLWN